MLKRKINAGLSLLTTFLLLDHAIFLALWMLSKGAIPKSANFMPRILTGAVLSKRVSYGDRNHHIDSAYESKVKLWEANHLRPYKGLYRSK